MSKKTTLIPVAAAALLLSALGAAAPASASSPGTAPNGAPQAAAQGAAHAAAEVAPLTDFASPGPMIDDATGRCLDSNTSGTAYAIPCNSDNNQKWNLEALDNGGYELWDNQTGLCLAVVNVVSSTLAYVGTATCDGGSAETWRYTQLSSNIEKWTSQVEYPWVLDSDTDGEGSGVGSVYVDQWNGGPYQKWNYQ